MSAVGHCAVARSGCGESVRRGADAFAASGRAPRSVSMLLRSFVTVAGAMAAAQLAYAAVASGSMQLTSTAAMALQNAQQVQSIMLTHQLPSEYRRNAREKDQQYGPAGSTLIQDRVASFGACRGVVFGNYGEASRDVHTLIHVAAKRLATKHWRLLGARSQGEVHGFYVAQLRRRMGVTAVREFARHRLRRAAYVGVPRAVVEQMMQQERRCECACTGRRPLHESWVSVGCLPDFARLVTPRSCNGVKQRTHLCCSSSRNLGQSDRVRSSASSVELPRRGAAAYGVACSAPMTARSTLLEVKSAPYMSWPVFKRALLS